MVTSAPESHTASHRPPTKEICRANLIMSPCRQNRNVPFLAPYDNRNVPNNLKTSEGGQIQNS